jgi:large subunit ribosomal protein L24
MKIVKGDSVYIRAGKDVASMKQSRLEAALDISDPASFQEKRAQMPMADQIAKANEKPGIRGKVIRVLAAEKKVVVSGVNMVTKHQKPRATSGAAALQQGGRIQMEAPLPVSRVMLVCPNCQKPTRVGMGTRDETRQTLSGNKQKQVRVRMCKQCGGEIPMPPESSGTR